MRIKSTKVKNKDKICKNGCEAKVHARELCRLCYKKLYYEEKERNNRGAIKRDTHPLLTVQIDETTGYARIKTKEGLGPKDWEKHHRYVMEQHLGRKLESFENVHHKNGNKADNRLENLELWITSQPRGQRIQDLIEHAKYILNKYDNEQYKF